MKTIVIGIAGGSESGKTTLAHKLKDALGDDIVLLCHDFYYKAHDDMPFEERQKLNFDHPDAFDTDLLIEDIRALKRGESILHPIYSFTEHTRLPQRVRVDPARVVIVEGILIFENRQLRDEMDIKVFVDTDADIRLIRRLLRDVKERGRTLDSVVSQYMSTVKPMHEQFVEPSKRNVDIIIPEGGLNAVALQMLLRQIQHFLREAESESDAM